MPGALRPAETPRLVVWTLMPTHHQSAFFAALRESGVQLQVCYLSPVTADRRELGWQVPERLPDGERYVEPCLGSLSLLGEWSDHVHIVGGANSRFLQALVAALSLRRIPWIHWSERGLPRPWWSPKTALRRAYAALVNRCALGAFAIGDGARDDFEAWGIDPTRIRFLPYSIAPLVAGPGDRCAGSPPRFIQVGSLTDAKGVDVLLQAFAGIARRHEGATLELVGKGPDEAAYRALAARLGCEDSVGFRGSVPAPEVADHIARADVLVLATRADGWGVVLNEGASLGKALVATDAAGATRHLIRDGQNGFRVRAGDVASLEAALERYCADPGLAALHGRVSAQVFEQFTPEVNAQRLRQGLASLAAARGLGAGLRP